VTITVHNANHLPLSNVTVNGSWSGGSSGNSSCRTNSSGQCYVTKSNISKSSSITFTVTGMSRANYTFTANANHDPDGDSNGTSITIVYTP